MIKNWLSDVMLCYAKSLQSCPTLRPHRQQPTMGCHCLLHSDVKYHLIFGCDLIKKCKMKVAESCLTLCNPMDYTVHRILEWGVFLFSRGSSQTRDRTQVSCIAGGFFTSWAVHRNVKSILFTFWMLTSWEVSTLFGSQLETSGTFPCFFLMYLFSYMACK